MQKLDLQKHRQQLIFSLHQNQISMEENQSILGMEVEPQGRANLTEVARWGKFLAIVGYVFMGIFVLMLAFAWNSFMNAFTGSYPDPYSSSIMSASSGFFLVIIVLFLGIFFTLLFFLLRGATRIKTGLRDNDQAVFNSGLANLRNYFIMFGVLSILRVLFSLMALF